MIINNPFSFAKKLLAFIKGDEISKSEQQQIENLIKTEPSIKKLYDELHDKDKISEQLALIDSFDIEKALKEIRKKTPPRFKYNLLFRSIAAILIIGLVAPALYLGFDSWSKNNTYDITQIGTGIVMLETANGRTFPLDSIGNGITEGNLNYRIADGTLILKETNIADITDPEKKSGVSTNIINVPNKSTYKLVLQDGTKITLNSGSSLQFPSSFGEGDRIVKLSGEAYFEVSKFKGKQFIVDMDGVSVTVLGTTFNVKSYNNEKEIYATLIEGSILFNYDKHAKKIIPGEQVVYNKNEHDAQIKYVDTKEYTAWVDKMFNFDNISLDDIMNQLSRWYDLKIEYASPELNAKNIFYSGKVKMYDHPVDILRKFEKSGELKFELKDKKIIISKK